MNPDNQPLPVTREVREMFMRHIVEAELLPITHEFVDLAIYGEVLNHEARRLPPIH